MKTYFISLFEHEHWANLKSLEAAILHPNPPKKAIEILSHIISAQRIWIDRIIGKKGSPSVWEVFEEDVLLELLEINYNDIQKLLNSVDFGQLISYENSQGKYFTNTIEQILTHLSLHAAHHRGQLALLLKLENTPLSSIDYIVYFR